MFECAGVCFLLKISIFSAFLPLEKQNPIRMATTKQKIRVVIADDHPTYGEGLKALFRDDDVVDFLEAATSDQATIEMVNRQKPDVVLMDYEFPEGQMDGVKISELLLAQNPGLKIIMLSRHGEVPLIKNALGSGLSGYLLKERSMAEIKKAIEAAHAGFEVVERGTLVQVLAEGIRINAPAKGQKNDDHPLTPRELEIAQLMARGKTTRDIAEELFISNNTVDTHKKNIYSKLGVKNVAELIISLGEFGLFP